MAFDGGLNSSHDILEILKHVFSWGIENNASKQSCKSLLVIFSAEVDGGAESIAFVLIEDATVVNGGRPFAIYTYLFDDDDPLILSAHRGFKQLDQTTSKREGA